jgi:hypothetical protein
MKLALTLMFVACWFWPFHRHRQSPPKPFTAAWYDYQCRVLGAVCPPVPPCRPSEGYDRAPANCDRGVVKQ